MVIRALSFFVVAKKKIAQQVTTHNKIIASLTTYGNRINTVHITITSLLEQGKEADKVLWLAEDEFNFRKYPELDEKL